MNKKLIILYWVMLFLPSLILGGVAFRTLHREQERINQFARLSAIDGTQTIADSLRFSIATVEEGLTDNLGRMRDGDIKPGLLRLERANPLVRNVFVWSPEKGLQYPDPVNAVTAKDKDFVVRYEALFSGRLPWSFIKGEIAAEPAEELDEKLIAVGSSLVTEEGKAQDDTNRIGDKYRVRRGRRSDESQSQKEETVKESGQEQRVSSESEQKLFQLKRDEQKAMREGSFVKTSVLEEQTARQNKPLIDISDAKKQAENKIIDRVSSGEADIGQKDAEQIELWQEAASQKSDSRSQLRKLAKTSVPADYYGYKSPEFKDEDIITKSVGEEPALPDYDVTGKSGANGWIPWSWENRIYLLGWVEDKDRGMTYGVELETAYLLSRLISDFPDNAPEGRVYALLDGNGNFLHRVGRGMPVEDQKPVFAVTLAPYLPNWQVAVYPVNGALSADSGKSFMVLSGLLLGILLVAIVAGGTLLLWQAHCNMVDAVQKTSFVSNVSHELKTPLTSIRMYAELLDEGRVKSTEKIAKYLKVIVSESQRLTRLVNNVLDFSRLEQGRKKYHLQDLDITQCVRESIENQRLRINKAGINIEQIVPQEPVVVKMDRDVLEQVLLNLIDNVIKYAATGKELKIELKAGTPFCEIRVMDRGPGVPRSHKQRIFEKFHRVDDSLTADQPGSGLGLSIAKKLLKDLGGDITFEPRRDGGSCFIVRLPCVPV